MNDTLKTNENAPLSAEEKATVRAAKRRELIKNALIIFLAAMLLLTLFSNTIMNRSLAEISTEAVASGKLTEKIRGSGMVEANQFYEVKAQGNSIVETIHVRNGQTVKKGDTLFTVKASEGNGLAEAQKLLAALELEYEKLLLVVPEDFAAQNQAIKNAREDYNAAVAKLEAAKSSQASAEKSKAEYLKNKTALSAKQGSQEKLSAAISAVDAEDYSAIPAEYSGNLPSLYSNMLSAEKAYSTASDLYTSVLESGGATASAEKALKDKEAALSSATTACLNEKNAVRARLSQELASLNSEISALESAVMLYESSQGNEASASIAELQTDATMKKRALEDLEIALERSQLESSMTQQQAALDLQAKREEADAQRLLVEELTAKSQSTDIKAEYDGVISSMNVKPGDITVPDSPIATIDISSMGYKMKISVTAAQASKVRVGAQSSVVNNLSGDAEAVLAGIKNDDSVSSGGGKLLEFDVTGDVQAGDFLEISIPCGSGNYDAIVPKSSVYEDAGGKFVLTVSSKSSPLGNRYYTKRVPVEVLASDELSSAVSGDISVGAYVLTASSKPVNPGEQVRMKEQ